MYALLIAAASAASADVDLALASQGVKIKATHAEAPALSLLQGHAKKLKAARTIKKAGASATDALRAAAQVSMDDFGGDGPALSLIQERGSKIKASPSCRNSMSGKKEAGFGMDPALFAAAVDGVEDGLAAISLLQSHGARLKRNSCRGATSAAAADASLDAAADAAADSTVSLLQEQCVKIKAPRAEGLQLKTAVDEVKGQ